MPGLQEEACFEKQRVPRPTETQNSSVSGDGSVDQRHGARSSRHSIDLAILSPSGRLSVKQARGSENEARSRDRRTGLVKLIAKAQKELERQQVCFSRMIAMSMTKYQISGLEPYVQGTFESSLQQLSSFPWYQRHQLWCSANFTDDVRKLKDYLLILFACHSCTLSP